MDARAWQREGSPRSSAARGRFRHQPERSGRTIGGDLVVVPAWIGVAKLISGPWVSGRYPVLDARGALVGLIDLPSVAGRPELHDRLAGEVCTPLDPGDRFPVVEDSHVPAARCDRPARDVLRRLRPAS